jgi:hypothetical protein
VQPDFAQPVVWTVEFSAQSEQRYRYNGYVTVLSITVVDACNLVLERWPDAAIHAVHRRSRGEVLVDPRIEIRTEVPA